MATDNSTDRENVSITHEAQALEGWASNNFTRASDRAPAAIVNPDASPLTLLSWAIGQIEQTDALMLFMSCSTGSGIVVEPSELAGALRHPIEQALIVLRAAAQKIYRAEGNAE